MKFFKFLGLSGVLTYFVVLAFRNDYVIGIMSLIYSIVYMIGAIGEIFDEE
jgi:hypothetical protein